MTAGRKVERIDELVHRLVELRLSIISTERILVTIAGIPGSGKSTIARGVCSEVNKILGKGTVVVLPQDGFHYYRSELNRMSNSAEVFKRRGAPFTFNSKRLLQKVELIKTETNRLIFAPSFDHKLKDPVENSIMIDPGCRIVIIEGNYVNLKQPEWNKISELAEEHWMITAEFDIVSERLVKRHVEAGICKSKEEALERVETNDLPNAKFIIENSTSPDILYSNSMR